ncbi:hypothetical protein OESDEN_08168 [Oesophagostomum dentatum]|uniref:Uncharacterized protein n=1 Tax=Oesophagostomum dentatum TaxID=61180 RepID=A0A0B1T719_OESDE|nr:hypothetical protein OESDEN_08168 [Oesophagostomum dentatum]
MFRFGMVPELVGRFPILVPFHALDEKMLVRVLQEPGNNLISQAQQLFAMDKMQLRSIMEKVLLQAKFECPGTATQTVVITGAVVRGESPYMTLSAPKKKDSSGDVTTPK